MVSLRRYVEAHGGYNKDEKELEGLIKPWLEEVKKIGLQCKWEELKGNERVIKAPVSACESARTETSVEELILTESQIFACMIVFVLWL